MTPWCVRFVLRSPTFACLAISCALGLSADGADATSPIDATDRNAPFAPAATVAPTKKAPAASPNSRVQERRFETTTLDRKTAPVDGQRAATEITEAREKNVREKDSYRPEGIDQPRSAYNHRPAAISTDANTTKPPMVSKYQDGMTAASASNMARFPAVKGSTSAKINRFVFRKNPAEPERALEGAAVTPAAGGSALGR